MIMSRMQVAIVLFALVTCISSFKFAITSNGRISRLKMTAGTEIDAIIEASIKTSNGAIVVNKSIIENLDVLIERNRIYTSPVDLENMSEMNSAQILRNQEIKQNHIDVILELTQVKVEYNALLGEALESNLETLITQGLLIGKLLRDLLDNADFCNEATADFYNKKFQGHEATKHEPAVPGSLKELLQLSEEACDAISPMVKAAYGYQNSNLKSDATNTFYSIAHELVQYLLKEHFFAGREHVKNFRGDNPSIVNIMTSPFSVGDLLLPAEFEALVMKTRNNIQQIAQKMDASSLNICSSIELTVHTYDCTGKVSKAKDYCSIFIDFFVQQEYDDPEEHSAILIYRPLAEPKIDCVVRGDVTFPLKKFSYKI